MAIFRRGDVWWYEFWFAGRRIRESSKSPSKTLAKAAEQKRRRELEEGFNNFTDVRHERVRTMRDIADDFLEEYRLRLPRSAVFAEYAVNHIKRLIGDKMLVDVNEACVIRYQNERLTEKASPKSVNEEVGFLLRIMGNPGNLLRVPDRYVAMPEVPTQPSARTMTLDPDTGRVYLLAAERIEKDPGAADPRKRYGVRPGSLRLLVEQPSDAGAPIAADPNP